MSATLFENDNLAFGHTTQSSFCFNLVDNINQIKHIAKDNMASIYPLKETNNRHVRKNNSKFS